MKACKCGSFAINHHCHGRDGSDDALCDVCYWRKRAEQPAQQERVAWMTQARCFVHLSEFTEAEAKLYGWKPLYTSPQRIWVGLTDEEIQDIYDAAAKQEPYAMCVTRRNIAKALEAKLKEKNT